ncbi:orotidine-5'-phosphate decarboxylase [Aureobasidium pullulans]|nr:orotidine-5'-phosphate decarboxylase [Aureobasidium pullulans]
MSRHATITQSYQERASLPKTSPVASYLLRLIAAKQTNLCVSADVSTTRELLQLAEEVGDSICMLKTHADIINDFGPRTIEGLKEIAAKKHFLVFEDRKFGDIGSTVQKQFTAGPLQIVRWANIINAHIFPGPAIITALSQAAHDAVSSLNTAVTTSISASPVPSYMDDSDEVDSPALSHHEDSDDLDRLSSDDDSNQLSTYSDPTGRKPSVVSVSTTISTKTESISPQPTPNHHGGPNDSISSISAGSAGQESYALARLGEPPLLRSLLILAEMSSAGNLMTGSYTEQCVVEARKNPEFVMGFIAQRTLNEQPGDNFITMTPGVQIGATGDGLGQQYNTPEKVIGEAGTDIIIVGRGVYGAQDKRAKAEEYRVRAWKAYEGRIGAATATKGSR